MLNLGNITFGLNADTTGLAAASRALENFGSRTSAAMAAAKRGIDTNIQELQRQEGAAVRALQNVQNKSAEINRMRIDPQVKLDAIQRLEEATSKFIKTMSTRADRPVDTLQFQRAQLGLKEVVDQVNRSLKEQATVATVAGNAGVVSAEKQTLAVVRAEFAVNKLEDAINRAARAGNITPTFANNLANRANRALVDFSGNMSPGMNAEGLLRQQNALKGVLNSVSADLRENARATTVASQGFRALGAAATLSMGPLSGVSFRIQALSQMVQDHGLLLGASAAAVVGFTTAVVGLGVALVHTTIEFQKAEMTLRGITGSAAVASVEIAEMRDIAGQAGLRFQEMGPAFSRFIASATGAGQSLQASNEEFRKFALVAGTLHLSTDEVNRSLLAFDQILSAGRLQGQELRQLFNVLPGTMAVATQAAKEMGLTLRDAMKKGQVEGQEFLRRFIDLYAQMLNIQPGTQIDTLQASLSRLANSWDLVLLSLNDTLQASDAIKSWVVGLTNLLGALAQNMDDVLLAVGTLTGALLGLAGAMVALSVITTLVGAFTAISTALRGFIALLPLATSGMEVLTAAQLALNAAGWSNPWVAIASALAMLIGVLLGAKAAHDIMANAMKASNDAMAEAANGAIEDYIAKQQALLSKTEQVTAALIKQQEVLVATQSQTMMESYDRYAQAQARANALRGGETTLGSIGAGGTPMGSALAMSRVGATADAAVAERNTWLADAERWRRSNQNLMALRDIANKQSALPSDTLDTNTTAGGSTGRTRDPERGLRSINEIIERAANAQQTLDNMWRGPQSSGLLNALDEASAKLFDMDDEQRKALTQIMVNNGVNVEALGGLEQAIAVVLNRTTQANEQVRRFNSLWNDVREGQTALEGINRQLEYLRSGGNPEDIWFVQAIEQAKAAIKSLLGGDLEQLKAAVAVLQGTGRITATAGAATIADAAKGNEAALKATIQLMNSLGYGLQATGTDAEKAEAALTEFYRATGRGSAELQEATRQITSLRDSLRALENQRAQLDLMRSGGNEQQFRSLEYFQQATEQLRRLNELNDTATLERINQLLAEQGFTVGTLTERYAAFLETQDRNQEALDRYREALRQNTQAWQDWAQNSLDALEKFATGTGSFGQLIKSILLDLAKTILHTTLFQPLANQARTWIGDVMSGAQPGQGNGRDAHPNTGNIGQALGQMFGPARSILDLFTKSANNASASLGTSLVESVGKTIAQTVVEVGVTTNKMTTEASATGSIAAFTAAVIKATGALNAMGSGGDGGSGNSLISWGMQLLGGGSGGGDPLSALAHMGGRAVGGPMMGGKAYRVSEIGSGTELFVPGQSGRMMSSSELGGLGGSPVHIDASSTVVVQGNVTEDILPQLQAILQQREMRLRGELPTLIDARVMESSSRGRYN